MRAVGPAGSTDQSVEQFQALHQPRPGPVEVRIAVDDGCVFLRDRWQLSPAGQQREAFCFKFASPEIELRASTRAAFNSGRGGQQ